MTKPLLFGLTLITICACSEQSAVSNYLCGQNLRVSIVEHNNDEATLRFNDQQFSLYRQVSGSGVKYSTEDVLLWSKGDEAMLILNGKKCRCSLFQQQQNHDV